MKVKIDTPDKVFVTMNLEEALALYQLCRSIGGNPSATARGYFSDIENSFNSEFSKQAKEKFGVDPQDVTKVQNLDHKVFTGSIYCNDTSRSLLADAAKDLRAGRRMITRDDLVALLVAYDKTVTSTGNRNLASTNASKIMVDLMKTNG